MNGLENPGGIYCYMNSSVQALAACNTLGLWLAFILKKPPLAYSKSLLLEQDELKQKRQFLLEKYLRAKVYGQYPYLMPFIVALRKLIDSE